MSVPVFSTEMSPSVRLVFHFSEKASCFSSQHVPIKFLVVCVTLQTEYNGYLCFTMNQHFCCFVFLFTVCLPCLAFFFFLSELNSKLQDTLEQIEVCDFFFVFVLRQGYENLGWWPSSSSNHQTFNLRSPCSLQKHSRTLDRFNNSSCPDVVPQHYMN